MNLVNYFCLGTQRKGLGRAASNTIVLSRKKKKGVIKTCLEEFGSGSHLNRHQVSEAEASGPTAERSPGLKPVGNVIWGRGLD